MSNVKRNYMYSVLYQILTIIIPLITTPYLSRTLGAENVGIYSYTNSIVQYFILISMLGILDYGNRTVAACNDKEEKGRIFEEIYLIQFSMSVSALVIYFAYIFMGNVTYKKIALIQSIALVASLLDINWFFWGIEKFKLTVTRNMVIKVISLISIFTFVKDAGDLWIYVFITVASTLISNVILWIFLKKEISFVKIRIKDSIKHLIPCLILMVPLLSRSIFVYMDKTMLGILSGMKETGYYEYSEKIILAATSLLTSLGTVMLPRISNLIALGKEKEAEQYTSLSIDFVVGLGIALTMGVMAVSDSLVVIFLGQEYANCGRIVDMMAVTIILVGWTNVIRTQYILPYKKDKVYMMAVFLGAVVDFIINVLLIKRYGAYGASIGWVAAEMIITVIQTYYAGKKLPIIGYIKKVSGFVVNALIMYIIVKVITYNINSQLSALSIGVIIGVTVYAILTFIYLKMIRKDLWIILIEQVKQKKRKKG